MRGADDESEMALPVVNGTGDDDPSLAAPISTPSVIYGYGGDDSAYGWQTREWNDARAAQEGRHYTNDAPSRAELRAEEEESDHG